MNPYLLSQLPLILGFVFLLILASVRPNQKESLSSIISVLALCSAAVAIWKFLPEGAQYFGGAIRVTYVGKLIAYLCLGLIALWLVLGLYPMLFIAPVEKTILTIGAVRGLAGLP